MDDKIKQIKKDGYLDFINKNSAMMMKYQS